VSPAEFQTLAKAEQQLWWFRGMQKILFRVLDPIAPRGATALEAGCGTGHFSRVLEQRYGWRMFPLDLAAEGLAYASKAGIRRLVQGDIASLPYRSDSFQVLASLDVLVHFPRGGERGALDEFARVLKPKGLLVLRVSALDILRSRHSEFTHERQRFTRARLMGLVEERGFRVLRCSYANSLLLPVALARFRVWEPLFRKPPASGTALVPRWLDRMLYMPLAVESTWLGWGANFPAGQSLLLLGEKL
jgi:ubiquinone/menaquinone biosynthesis C-methylase UbiE